MVSQIFSLVVFMALDWKPEALIKLVNRQTINQINQSINEGLNENLIMFQTKFSKCVFVLQHFRIF